MLQTDVEVLGLVGLHAAQGHPRLPNEFIMRQLVFVADGHPASERRRGERACERRGKKQAKSQTDELCAHSSREAAGTRTVD